MRAVADIRQTRFNCRRMVPRLALTKAELAALAGALACCAAVLWLDLRVATDFTKPILYAGALMLAYPVRRTWALPAFTALATELTLFGTVAEPAVRNAVGDLNRAVAILVLAGLGLVLWRMRGFERALFRLSTSDPLTGALTAPHFMTEIRREQKRTERYGAAFSLLMLDIDEFARFNRTHGHDVGEAAIKRVAETCLAHMRPTDVLCRYGGEEFIIVLAHTEEAGARLAAERLREAIARLEIPAGAAPARLTVSIGVTTRVPGAEPEQLIACLVQALEAAKASGRNRVRVGQLAGAGAPAPAPA
jgi:diguanylate cyclase (GGDEF)-like protein